MFKKSLGRFFSQKNITNLFSVMKENIVNQAVLELSGSEKKSNVDNAVIEFIQKTFIPKNMIMTLLVNVLIDFVPRITQGLFDIFIGTKAGE